MNKNLRTVLALIVMAAGGILVVQSFSTMDYVQAIVGLLVAGGGFVIFGRGIAGRGKSRDYIAIDFIAVILIALFFLTFLVGGLSGLLSADQQSQNVATFLLEMEFGGLLLAFISKVLVLAPLVSAPQFDKEAVYIASNFAAFFVLNLVVPPSGYKILGLSGLSTTSPFVTVMISIPETTTLQIWLAPWLANISRTGALGGSFLAAIVAAAYHLFVLGTSPGSLGVVFGAFFVADYTAIKGKLASIPLTTHLANNFVSVGLPHV